MCWISYRLQGSGQLKKTTTSFWYHLRCCCSSFACCTNPDTTSSPYFQSLRECSWFPPKLMERKNVIWVVNINWVTSTYVYCSRCQRGNDWFKFFRTICFKLFCVICTKFFAMYMSSLGFWPCFSANPPPGGLKPLPFLSFCEEAKVGEALSRQAKSPKRIQKCLHSCMPGRC